LLISSGTSLGPYEIVAAIGAGGMGEVYRAKDKKLNREVALKILPEAFTSDDDRLARFRREAQVLASLNHPNIAAIYGFEDSGATHALVMELVDGPDLSEIIGAAVDHAPSGSAAPTASSREMAACHLLTPCRSRSKSPMPSKPRTNRASSIAISSPRTSRSAPTAR
jgi:serine/threonine protein kinase